MIRHLIVLYLAVVTLVLIDPNPLYVLPLLPVSLSFILKRRWIGLLGILGYSTIGLSSASEVSFTDMVELLSYTSAVVLPTLVAVELVLTPAPYRLERLSPRPLILTASIIALLFLALYVLTRLLRIGLFLESDVSTQIFILISLSLFFSSPFLLSSLQGGSRDAKKSPTKPLFDKNE